MNHDPDFDASADMRLIELQRTAMGLAPPNRSSWETRYGLEGMPAPQSFDTPEEPAGTPVLSVVAQATPESGVIPGAIVTFSLSVANDGAADARDIVVTAPLPGGAVYRAGSFTHDGRALADERAEEFFGDGFSIDELRSASRTSFLWKVGVRLGSKSLLVAPHVRAGHGAVIGAHQVIVTRKDQTKTVFTSELDRAGDALVAELPSGAVSAQELPFYELDSEEQLVHEAADAALSSAAPTIETTQTTASVPALQTPHPEPEETPAQREAVMRYGRFDRTTLVFFERTFLGSKEPAVLQHCIFANALACALSAGGADDMAIKAHLDAQSQVLHRIALHERLGKKEPIAGYAGALLAELSQFQAAPVQAHKEFPPGEYVALSTELSEPSVAVIERIGAEHDRWDFLKARQLTLALQAQRADVADRIHAAAIEAALRQYAQASMTMLQKLFVRIRTDRTTGSLFTYEPALDACARSVLSALSPAITR